MFTALVTMTNSAYTKNLEDFCINFSVISWTIYVMYALSCRYVHANLKCNSSVFTQRWLWTKHGQLLNLDTLQCATAAWRILEDKYYILLLEKCRENDKRQVWKCRQNDPYYIWQQQSGGYLHYGNYYSYITSYEEKSESLKWKRYGSSQTLCSEGNITLSCQ